MPIKPLLFEFDNLGTEGINIPYPDKWNQIDNVDVLSNIKFAENRDKEIKIDVKSIPSPYARMILFRNAFEDEFFPKMEKLKILEDILDAMEFIFLYQITSYEDKLKFIRINLAEFATESSLNTTHKKYLKTLYDLSEYYEIEQNKDTYQYNSINVFYLKEGSDNYDNVIAGTSPFTGFFTPEVINKDIKGFFEYEKDVTGRKTRKLKPFESRNKKFLKYLNRFYKELPYSAAPFKKELEKLYKNLTAFSIDDIEDVDTATDIKENESGEMKKIEIVPNLSFEVFNGAVKLKSYYKMKPSIIPISDEAGAVLIEDMPLVLTTNNVSYKYFEDIDFPNNWDLELKNCIVSDTERKVLPCTIKKYPWLSPEIDFLEDKLVKLPYPQDSGNMYDGRSDDNNFQYLIPLTEKFFKYFKPEEIEEYFSYRIVSCSDKNIDSDVIEVMLRIPIEGDGTKNCFITVKKIYSGDTIVYNMSFKQDSKTRKITSIGVYSALWPTIMNHQTERQIDRYYIIQYEHLNDIDKMWKDSRFFNYRKINGNQILKEIKNTSNFRDHILKENRNMNTRIYSVYYPPELILMTTEEGSKGFFLPKYDNHYVDIDKSTNHMHVGIDFGTSNTVIAYKTDEKISLMPIVDTNFKKFYGNRLEEEPEKEFDKVINMFFVPMRHGNQDDGKPFSTEVCYLASKEKLTTTVLHSNITFKREIPSDVINQIKTNLKWANNDYRSRGRNEELIELFFKQLRTIIEKQAVEKGIPVKNIHYRYSYPLAFNEDQKSNLERIFNEFKKFADPLDESLCCAKYFARNEGSGFDITNVTPAITIDIGGGTADIVGYVNRISMFKSSILLGGQDIFNDIIKDNTINNPFVASLKKHLLDNRDDSIRFVYAKEIFDKYNDSHSLFSYIVSKDEFNKVKLDLHNTEFYKYFRLTILYFYSAILYYVALNIKKYFQEANKSIDEVTEIRIGIAGNGSKLLEWICRGKRWEEFAKTNSVYKNLFSSMFVETLGINDANKNKFTLTIIQSKSPKQEVVKGLIIDHKDVELFGGGKINLLAGENLIDESNEINVFDDYDKINRSNYPKLTYKDFETSQISIFNKTFLKLIESNSKELLKDFDKIYLENFCNIIGKIDKNTLMSEVNLLISDFFHNKPGEITEFKNSYFITEIKACIELIKKRLKDDDLLGNKV
ncbi:MAG: hypothetical protein ACOYN6_06670 [Ignavibacteria bacterium]